MLRRAPASFTSLTFSWQQGVFPMAENGAVSQKAESFSVKSRSVGTIIVYNNTETYLICFEYLRQKLHEITTFFTCRFPWQICPRIPVPCASSVLAMYLVSTEALTFASFRPAPGEGHCSRLFYLFSMRLEKKTGKIRKKYVQICINKYDYICIICININKTCFPFSNKSQKFPDSACASFSVLPRVVQSL